MRTRLQGLERIAVVYKATQHAHTLGLEQAAAALRQAESWVGQQREWARRSSVAGKAALGAGDQLEWRMQEAQRRLSEWNTERLFELKLRREALMREAAEAYRAGRMQLEQMESVLRELRAKSELEASRRAQRDSDDRFLARRWWHTQGGASIVLDGEIHGEDGTTR